MRDGVRRTTSRMARSAVELASRRIASSERVMGLVYDLMNEANFSGLAEHEEMLSDRVRVDAYHRAIHRHVQPGDVVVDLGTGTGLLAFMASRAGAAKVYALEHSDLIEVAREIGRVNGFTNIEFIRTNSREFTAPELVDVIVHEQMGDELFNENMVRNVMDLRERVLRPGGRILPARFRLFVEPVTLRDSMRVRRFWNIELPDGIDLAPLRHSPVTASRGSGANDQVWARAGSVAATVGQPRPVLEIDLGGPEPVTGVATKHRVERTATSDVIVDGACVWFEAHFDDDLVLSTSPLSTNTSWGNRLYRLDVEVAAGGSIAFDVDLGDVVDPATWTVALA